MEIVIVGVIGILLGWLIVAPNVQILKNKWEEAKGLQDFETSVLGEQLDDLYIFSGTELDVEGNEVHRAQAMFANRHNAELLSTWRKTKNFVHCSVRKHDPKNPLHTAAIVMSAALERKFEKRDIKNMSRGGRRRYPQEPDNFLPGLQQALTKRADIKKGLMTQMTMVPPSSLSDEDD